MPVPGLPANDTTPYVDEASLSPYERAFRRFQTMAQPGMAGGLLGAAGRLPPGLNPPEELSPYDSVFKRFQGPMQEGMASGASGAAGPLVPDRAPGRGPPLPVAAAPDPATPPGLSPQDDDAKWAVPGVAKQAGAYAPPSGELSPEDQKQWSGPGTATSKDLPQPLANPKPSGLSAEEQGVLDAQDQQRKGALLGDLQKFQGYQKNNQAWADSQATGQPGPGYQWPPPMDTVGSGDSGGQFPDVSHQARGNELMRLLGMPVPSQQGSDAYQREKYATKQADIEGRRGKLLEASKGPQSPLQQQDLLRQYNQLGLEESQGPDPAASPPALQVLSGSQPSLHTFPGAAQRASVTPGTPQYEESQRAGMARGALGEALQAMPHWLKLEEARLHTQAQLAGQHNTMLERLAAGNPNASADQLLAQAKVLTSLNKVAQGEKTGAPGVSGVAPPPGLLGPPALTPEEQLRAATAARDKASAGVPDEQRLKDLYGKLPNLTDPEQLVEELSGQSLAMKHEPSRREIVKLIQQQGTKGPHRLVPKLEELLMRHADLGGLSAGRDWSDVEGVPVRSFQDTGVFRKQVQSPYGGIQGERYFNFLGGPLARLLTGQGPIVEPTTKEQIAAYAAKARASAMLLRALHESGYQR